MKDEKVEAMREFILLLTKQVKDAQIEASIKTMLDKLIVEKMAEIEAAVLAQGEPYDKTEMNAFVQNLYDQKMREGKHGHYETMFHVVHQAIRRAHPSTSVNQALLEALKLASVMLKTGSPEYDERDAIEVIDSAIAQAEGK